MGDCEAVIPTHDGEQHVILAAQHIVKALWTNKNLSDDMRKILADLDTHLSTMTILTESKAGLTNEVEDQLICAQQRVMSWQSNQLMIWDSGPQEVSRYLQAVDEVRRLTESLGSLLSNNNGKQKELLDRAHSVLQMAMARLEKELIHILAHSKQFLGPRYISFQSYEGSVVCEESIVSNEDDSMGGKSRRESNSTESEECIISLVHPNVVSDIKSIATVMFASNYDQEFCQAFTSFWEIALNEFLINCEVDKLSIEDVLKMKWDSLYCRIRKWCRAMKAVIRFYLCSEKWLFDQVLGEFGSICSICFVEASKTSMLCLLNFGEAIAMGPHSPEILFCLIDMYEVLANLLQDIDALFSEEFGSFIRIEFHELLMRLGNSARVTFKKFGNEVASETSNTPFPRGGIHPLTKYVMNYIKTLAGYGDTLNLLLERQDGEELGTVVDAEDGQSACSYHFRPMARYLWSVASILETNLDKKSRLYRDCSLKHIFMMNNIHYMVEKVKDPELGTYFGDEWIKKYIVKFQQHARSYERATWSSVLSLLRDDGKLGKSVLRERCRRFNVAFEEVYKSQTGWIIPDVQLREDVQISTSQKVIHAYRTFMGRYSICIEDKYIKYTEHNLENYILDLFEGSQRSLHNSRK
ncbi:exocyst complex component EXO70E2-like [Cornus florida]|uniref:exocyst complex component EXO70E2-like n=1 Tax=Cornus florida TaxID=4283 RepID=UPI0028A02127|nr:exocyst complex component EXO70E2-like [Cornus florida]